MEPVERRYPRRRVLHTLRQLSGLHTHVIRDSWERRKVPAPTLTVGEGHIARGGVPLVSRRQASAPRYYAPVPHQNVEIMRRLLASYVQGDYGLAIEGLDADVELWLGPQTFPESGPFRGRTAVIARLAEAVSSFDDYWASAEGAELIDAGDWVVMINRTGGRGRASGAPVEQLWTVAYKLRSGKIVRIEYHPNKEEALKAISGAEPSEQG